MKFKQPLLRGKLIKRYKRFLADIILDSGEEITAHCVNSGAMLGLKEPGLVVWVSPQDSPTRTLKYTWELVDAEGTIIGCNTSLPNKLAEEGIREGIISELSGYESIRREVKYGKNSRIDILLEAEGKVPCYVEIKNVHLKRGNLALFPDSVTTRGVKHLDELAEVVRQGGRAVMLYVVQRDDCTAFDFADDIDPRYAESARKAFAAGVERYAYQCDVSTEEIKVVATLAVKHK